MANYYFVGTLLPELRIGEKPEISFRDFEQLVKDNLSVKDIARIRMIRNFYDIYNLRAYWRGEPFDYLGTLDYNEMEEALVTRSVLPSYIFQYLDKYESKEERLRHFSELRSRFFHEEVRRSSGILREYLITELEIRLVLVAFRAKLLGRDIFAELQYEDPENDFIAQIFAQKDSSQFEPPEKYEDLKVLFTQYVDDPLALQKALLEYRFNKIGEILGQDLFSSERIFGYMLQLIMVERWNKLDKQKGLEIVDSMLKEAS